jgi:hypothetical protein
LQVIQGQKSISQVQLAELILLVIEGACVIVIAVSYVVRLLSTISMHRQALFSVFLAIPHGYLRTLASKSVSIGDDDEEDEGALAMLLLGTSLAMSSSYTHKQVLLGCFQAFQSGAAFMEGLLGFRRTLLELHVSLLQLSYS